MDLSLVSGLLSSLTATVELGKVAMGARDANKLAAAVAEMNDKIIGVQMRLADFAIEAAALRQQLAEAELEKRKLQQALSERGRYQLVEVSQGQFAYRLKVEQAADALPVDAQPLHYVCQRGFDDGRKVVLQRVAGPWAYAWSCSGCNAKIDAT